MITYHWNYFFSIFSSIIFFYDFQSYSHFTNDKWNLDLFVALINQLGKYNLFIILPFIFSLQFSITRDSIHMIDIKPYHLHKFYPVASDFQNMDRLKQNDLNHFDFITFKRLFDSNNWTMAYRISCLKEANFFDWWNYGVKVIVNFVINVTNYFNALTFPIFIFAFRSGNCEIKNLIFLNYLWRKMIQFVQQNWTWVWNNQKFELHLNHFSLVSWTFYQLQSINFHNQGFPSQWLSSDYLKFRISIEIE